MGVNTYFGTRRTNIQHSNTNYGPEKSRVEIGYYRQKYCFPEKRSHMQGKLEISGKEEIYFSEYFNSNHIEFVGHDTCGKLMWASGEYRRNKNKTIR